MKTGTPRPSMDFHSQNDLDFCLSPFRDGASLARLALASLSIPAILVLAIPATQAAPAYKVIDLGVLPGGTWSSAYAINTSGEIAGSATDADGVYRAVRYCNGAMAALGEVPGYPTAGAYGINSSGQIVGYAERGYGDYHSFLSSNGSMTDMGTLGGLWSRAVDINDRGQVVGDFGLPEGAHHAFLYEDGRMTDLGTLGGLSSMASRINGIGQVVGQADTPTESHAFLYTTSTMIDLGRNFAGYSVASDINARGQVVGYATMHPGPDHGPDHAFFYSNGTMTDLGTLGGSFSYALAIDAGGRVYGYSGTTGDAATHAFIYSNGRMADLNDLIDPASGWTLYLPEAANDSGWVVGYGFHHGDGHAFLLIPAPRPLAQTAEAGSAVRLTAPASGPLLFCLWYMNGTNLVSYGTNSNLQVNNVQFPQSGGYTVVITNAAVTVTSPPAMLQVIAPVQRRPVPAVMVTGEPATLVNIDYSDFLHLAPNWTTLASVSLTTMPQYWFDLTMPLPPQRFYRAWQSRLPTVVPSLDLHLVPAITLTGNIGGSVRVDAIHQFGPTNAWFTLETVTLTNLSQLYFDTSAWGQPQRLYRLVP